MGAGPMQVCAAEAVLLHLLSPPLSSWLLSPCLSPIPPCRPALLPTPQLPGLHAPGPSASLQPFRPPTAAQAAEAALAAELPTVAGLGPAAAATQADVDAFLRGLPGAAAPPANFAEFDSIYAAQRPQLPGMPPPPMAVEGRAAAAPMLQVRWGWEVEGHRFFRAGHRRRQRLSPTAVILPGALADPVRAAHPLLGRHSWTAARRGRPSTPASWPRRRRARRSAWQTSAACATAQPSWPASSLRSRAPRLRVRAGLQGCRSWPGGCGWASKGGIYSGSCCVRAGSMWGDCTRPMLVCILLPLAQTSRWAACWPR